MKSPTNASPVVFEHSFRPFQLAESQKLVSQINSVSQSLTASVQDQKIVVVLSSWLSKSESDELIYNNEIDEMRCNLNLKFVEKLAKYTASSPSSAGAQTQMGAKSLLTGERE